MTQPQPQMVGPHKPQYDEPLTVREAEVAGLVAFAFTDSQIADALFISVATVKAHVVSIMGKLGLRNRTAICRWVLVNHYEGGKPILKNNAF